MSDIISDRPDYINILQRKIDDYNSSRLDLVYRVSNLERVIVKMLAMKDKND